MKVYESCDGDADCGSKWLESSLSIIDDGQSGPDSANSNPQVKQHTTLYLIEPPAKAEVSSFGSTRRNIVFRCPHVIVDGIRTLILLHNLITYTAEALKLQEPILPSKLSKTT